MNVPDRAVVSIGPALGLGFLLGLIAAMELLGRGARLRLGLIGAVVVAITGPLSVIGLRAGVADRLVVGVLRGLLARSRELGPRRQRSSHPREERHTCRHPSFRGPGRPGSVADHRGTASRHRGVGPQSPIYS